jgi:hypothetical protein
MSKSATADLDGADPESSAIHCSGFRVRAKTRAPE